MGGGAGNANADGGIGGGGGIVANMNGLNGNGPGAAGRLTFGCAFSKLANGLATGMDENSIRTKLSALLQANSTHVDCSCCYFVY